MNLYNFEWFTKRGVEDKMFHKPKAVKVYVKKSVLFPLRMFIFVIAFYSLIDIYMILDTGVATDRWGNVNTVEDDMFSFISTLLVSITIAGVCLYFCFWGIKPIIKENSQDEEKRKNGHS